MKRGEKLRGKDMKLISIGKENIHILNWVRLFAFCLFGVVCLRLKIFNYCFWLF